MMDSSLARGMFGTVSMLCRPISVEGKNTSGEMVLPKNSEIYN